MDAKSKRILDDECKLTDQIPYEIKAGGIPAEIYGDWIVELKSELQLWKNQAERNALTHQDIDLMCKDMLMKNVQIRRHQWFWFMSGSTKVELSKNRLRYLFLEALEAVLKGELDASNLVNSWTRG